MTLQHQRIAIAQLCGWNKVTTFTTYPKSWGGNPKRYDHPLWQMTLRTDIPQDECQRYGWHGDGQIELTAVDNYPCDLNAMHEAEKVLTDDQQHEYIRLLSSQHLSPEGYWTAQTSFAIASATAAQRAKALLIAVAAWQQ